MSSTSAKAPELSASDEWMVSSLPPHDTIKEAIKAAKKLEGGKWKWSRPSGNCKTNAYHDCNAHVECGRRMKVLKFGEKFYIFFKGKHSEEPTLKKRKNSLLTWDEDDQLVKAVDVGVKPAQVRVRMTKEAASELIDKGVDPLSNKDEQGGLTGTLRIEYMSIRCIGYVLLTVLRMYLACIHIIL